MLKRTAENALWLNRFRVRTEVLSRVITTHYENLLDHPRRSIEPHRLGAHVESWMPCLIVSGINIDTLASSENSKTEVLRKLISDTRNQRSVAGMLRQVHTNLRCCRDFFSPELFEAINHSCIHGGQVLSLDSNLTATMALLHEINLEMMTINGLIEHRVARNEVYYFLKAGEFIERSELVIRLLQMAEDESFREAPVLQLVTDRGEGRSIAAAATDNLPNTRHVRSALGRARVRMLASCALGTPTLESSQPEYSNKPAGPGDIDRQLMRLLIIDNTQPQSLASTVQQLASTLNHLDKEQAAITLCQDLQQEITDIDLLDTRWTRDYLLDRLDEFLIQISAIYDAVHNRYIRGSGDVNSRALLQK